MTHGVSIVGVSENAVVRSTASLDPQSSVSTAVSLSSAVGRSRLLVRYYLHHSHA